jgi:hypothetical protein
VANAPGSSTACSSQNPFYFRFGISATPSDSHDLLGPPQGPLLLTITLWSWWQDPRQPRQPRQPRLAHLQWLAALLAEAPERFPLNWHAFVGELLLATTAVDRTSSGRLVQCLASAVRRPFALPSWLSQAAKMLPWPRKPSRCRIASLPAPSRQGALQPRRRQRAAHRTAAAGPAHDGRR